MAIGRSVVGLVSVLMLASTAQAASLKLAQAEKAGLSKTVSAAAKKAWACTPKMWRGATFSIIDFSKDSTQKRLYVIDVATGTLQFHELVTHGQKTGEKYSRRFSNINGSHQSSLGLFRTAESYEGQHGYSMRLDGLEPGFNDKARPRAIVMHGAEYATQSFVDKYGRLGRSWGCPAVAPEKIAPIIDTIKDGSLLFAYYPKKKWLRGSRFLNCK